MNLDELRSAQAKERRKDSLQHLRDSFYDDVAAYVADLRAARDRRAEQVEKPFSDDDVRRLSDEVETAEEVAEALYERRVGKVVKLASFAAADMSVDADGMTTEERQLFDDLVDRITENKSRVLDVLAGEVPATDSTPPTDSTDSTPPTDPTPPADEPPATDSDAHRPASDAPTEDRAPPAPTPEPPEAEAAEGADEPPTEPSAAAESGGRGDALAGAMGGSTEEVTDALDASTDGGARAADGESKSDASAPQRDAGDGDGPTPVPPEPAPPGAPGVEGEDDAGTGEPSGGAGTGDEATSDEATSDAGESDAETGVADSTATDRATVRVTRDVGSIFGVDEREYDLASEDVVTLPAENAAPLVERDAAERLD